MKCKYKKFLKAAYIDYSEDYCGHRLGTFTKPAVTTPIIVITGTTATIACAISGATIYYTLDGSTPTSSSTLYTGAITLTLSCTIKAIAIKPGMSDSAVASESYVHITYLTQWKIVGNSEVHTDPYLTSWKVSGNSVVDNNTILSCGDLGQDGKYHVKISNGVTVYDIPLDAPLRKVNDVADTIEFPSSVDGKALVTRVLKSIVKTLHTSRLDSFNKLAFISRQNDCYDDILIGGSRNIISNFGITLLLHQGREYNGIAVVLHDKTIYVRNGEISQTVEDYNTYFATLGEVEFIYELATPTTELIDVSQFPVSPTDTYTSANVTPYSAFEHTKHSEIWSCGEYNATDGKYHILVQPLGGSIADIALTEPLRKVNDVADTIEFPSNTEGKALVTRNLRSVDLGDCIWAYRSDIVQGLFSTASLTDRKKEVNPSMMCEVYTRWTSYTSVESASTANTLDNYNYVPYYKASLSAGFSIYFRNTDYADADDFAQAVSGLHLLYELTTPTTELVDAPQIEEADSYSCVITPGGKAVSWSSFETE